MSQENVELVRRAVEAWNAEGVEALVEFYTDDVIWYPFREAPENDEFHGHDGIRDVMAGWRDSFDEWTLATGEMRDYGERVLWLGEISARMKGSGGLVKQPMGSLGWDFRDGTRRSRPPRPSSCRTSGRPPRRRRR